MTNTSFIGGVNRFSNNDKIAPFIAYKVVSMRSPDEHGDVKLYGPHHPEHAYGFSDEAICKNKKPCTHFETCSCGFYGYNLIEDALGHWEYQCNGKADVGAVLLQVAFSGKVVVCEKGYRSSHQRVKAMLLNSCCLCSSAANMLAPHKNGNYVPVCSSCLETAPVESGSNLPFRKKAPKTAQRPQVNASTFEDFILRHSPTGFNNMKVASISDFSSKDAIHKFFGVKDLFTFLPGIRSSVPSNFSDYLSTLDQEDMDKVLSLVSTEMGRRMTNTDGFNAS